METAVLDAFDDENGSAQPTARLVFVDAGHLYVSWTWQHADDRPRLSLVDRSLLAPVLAELCAQLPSQTRGESLGQALDRALGHGAFLDLDRELRLSASLTSVLVPGRLAQELNLLATRGLRPHLRVQPSPSLTQVPWELLVTSGTERLVDMADLSVLPPTSLRNAAERTLSPWAPAGPVVLTLDPVVPDRSDRSAHERGSSGLGSVLGRVTAGSALATMVSQVGDRARPPADGVEAFGRSDLTRDVVEQMLVGAARWLYVGHVSGSTHALDTRLHLSDTADTAGRAGVVGDHRPLAAADLILGHRPETPRPWRFPNRVALVACESGVDAQYAEPTGLVAAMVAGGAEFVTSTRWTLPTDAGLERHAPGMGPSAHGVLADAVVAINTAQDTPSPVASMATWQRKQARLWAETGDPRFSPVVWAAFQTTWAPVPRPAPSYLRHPHGGPA